MLIVEKHGKQKHWYLAWPFVWILEVRRDAVTWNSAADAVGRGSAGAEWTMSLEFFGSWHHTSGPLTQRSTFSWSNSFLLVSVWFVHRPTEVVEPWNPWSPSRCDYQEPPRPSTKGWPPGWNSVAEGLGLCRRWKEHFKALFKLKF